MCVLIGNGMRRERDVKVGIEGTGGTCGFPFGVLVGGEVFCG